MSARKALGKGLTQIMNGQNPNGNKMMKITNPSLTEKLIALERARKIREVEKIPFLRRYASPKEATAFHEIVQQLRAIDERVAIAPEDMESAKRVLGLGKGQVGPRIRKTDVQAAVNLLKKYGPHRGKPKNS